MMTYKGMSNFQHLLVFLLVVLNFVSAEWLDMSYNFDNQTVYWPTAKNFSRTQTQGEMTKKGPNYDISASEHGGTHSDSPSHFYEEGLTVDQIPLEKLIGPAVVVNITQKTANNPEYRLSVKDLEEWESANGKIPDGAIVLMFSGWGKRYWPDYARFFGTATRNTSDLHFPGFHPEAAEWIVRSGKVSAIGVDTASLDYGQYKVFASHGIFSKGNIPGFEMVANLDKLPPRGATIYAAPIKTKGGTGGPTRIFAELGNKDKCNTKRTNITWLDLTHSLVNGTTYWPGSTAFSLRLSYKMNRTRYGYYLIGYDYSASEHSGTHIESPAHFAKGKWSTHEIPLDILIGQAVKVDISGKAAQNSNYQLKPSDIEEWEKQHGKIPEGVIVLVYTGWAKLWSDRSKYYGMRPGENNSLNFPGIHPDAASWMVKLKVKAVGLDTPSLDYGPSQDFKSHKILSADNIPGFQNVANIDKLPVTGATVFAAPMKIKDGSGGPLRIFAKLGGECPTHSGADNRAIVGHVLLFIAVFCVYYINV